jgi:hypothetical protein
VFHDGWDERSPVSELNMWRDAPGLGPALAGRRPLPVCKGRWKDLGINMLDSFGFRCPATCRCLQSAGICGSRLKFDRSEPVPVRSTTWLLALPLVGCKGGFLDGSCTERSPISPANSSSDSMAMGCESVMMSVLRCSSQLSNVGTCSRWPGPVSDNNFAP